MFDASTLFFLITGIVYLFMGLMALLLAKYVLDATTSYNLDAELTEADNPAVGLSVAGYFIGVIIVFLGAVIGPELDMEADRTELLTTFAVDFAYALGGIVLLNLSRLVVDKLVLPKFSIRKEIIEDRNVGTGAVEFAVFVASGLIIAGAIHGEGGGPLTALVFFILGQVTLVLFAKFYQWMTAYDIHAEIERDNVSAGVALGANLIAISVLVLHASTAPFESWQVNLTWFGIDVTLGFVVLFVLRKITGSLFLRGSTLAHEIANDRNINAAWIEGSIAIGLACMIFFLA